MKQKCGFVLLAPDEQDARRKLSDFQIDSIALCLDGRSPPAEPMRRQLGRSLALSWIFKRLGIAKIFIGGGPVVSRQA